MTTGYAEMLRKQGVRVSEPRPFPIEWINFRLHPCPHWPGVKRYQAQIQAGHDLPPIVICRTCLVVLDGWHRVAAAWLSNRSMVSVSFADYHWMRGKDHCRVDLTHWIESLRPWTELAPISGSYLASDWDQPEFKRQRDELVEFGDRMPKMRLWEHVRAVIFFGRLKGKKVLDVGTRESIVPHYLSVKRLATVTAVDIAPHLIKPSPHITIEKADATALPYEDNSFDHIVCTACVKHIPGWGDRKAVKEMVRVVRPRGLVAISFDFGDHYEPYPGKTTGRRLYDARTVQRRLVSNVGAELIKPADFMRSDWDDWPIKQQARSVYEKGVNVQVGFVLLRKPE
jgi:ubiquinone/menaquinone biosynthesis C-methylase UbiE